MLISKKFHNISVIIHLGRLLGCVIAEISKIHWKSMIKKHQNCFANISATKAQISMISYMVVNYYLVRLSFIFHEDPCINARAQVVNTRAHVLLRVRAFTTRLRALNANISSMKAWIFIKFHVVVHYYLVSWSFEFHEDPWINVRKRVVNALYFVWFITQSGPTKGDSVSSMIGVNMINTVSKILIMSLIYCLFVCFYITP